MPAMHAGLRRRKLQSKPDPSLSHRLAFEIEEEDIPFNDYKFGILGDNKTGVMVIGSFAGIPELTSIP